MSSDIAIRVEDLSKCYQIYDKPRDRLMQMLARGRKQYFREFWALKDISFTIKKGETVGIVGRNGSGKSTLLQLICGTLNPTGGTIQTNGRIAALLELGSGFNPEFTGHENVYMNATILGLRQEEIEERFDDIAAFADIGEFIERPVKTYSSGMLVRLAFAVQAMVNPDILIVDEALAVGDEKFQRKCFARLEDLKSKGTSIIFVSHSGPQIIELCDWAVLLENGLRLMTAKPSQVVRAYQKLIYAPPDEQSRLVHEYQAADRNEKIENLPAKSFSSNIKSDKNDVFDSGLIPETTTIYPMQGAEIQSIEILDEKGHVVNILRLGQNYKFIVAGLFLSDVENVYFGIHIRSISGVVITGQRHPEEGQYLQIAHAGAKFKVTFEFQMSVIPGAYFAGVGIWSNSEPSCLHRVIDAIMFRVLNIEQQRSFGYCDLMTTPPLVEIL